MSERAQCVITDGRQSEIFYSTWGAAALDIDLIAGPEAAARQIRRLYRPDEELREPVWIEAAALIDTSRKLLAIYSWHFEGYAHRAALHAILSETWPGWDLRWAYAGVEDIARHSGVPAQPAERTASPATLALVDPTALDDADTLVTVLQPDGTIRGYGLWTDTTDAFWAGPDLVDRLAGATPLAGLPVFPQTGLHLDPLARTAIGWTTLEIAGLTAGWPRHWPGWQLDFHEDRFAPQLTALAGGLTPPQPTLDADGLTLPAPTPGAGGFTLPMSTPGAGGFTLPVSTPDAGRFILAAPTVDAGGFTLPAPTLDAGLDVLARRLTAFWTSPEIAYQTRAPADHRPIEAAIERARRSAAGLPRWPGLAT